jgi:uncharacterized protein (DUF1778 family)
MGTKPPKRRKTVRKEKSIQIRVTDEQKTTLTEAAEKAGIGVSSWMLTVSLEAAARKLADGGGKT